MTIGPVGWLAIDVGVEVQTNKNPYMP